MCPQYFWSASHVFTLSLPKLLAFLLKKKGHASFVLEYEKGSQRNDRNLMAFVIEAVLRVFSPLSQSSMPLRHPVSPLEYLVSQE